VETIDGVIAFGASDQASSGSISGDKEQDKMVMGLLRARADAIVFGTSSLAIDANHLRTASFIYPPLAQAYAEYRRQLGKQEQNPLSVVMTSSGDINLADRIFQTPGLRVLIATTIQGDERLSRFSLPAETTLRIIENRDHDSASGVSPRAVLHVLAQEYGVNTVLYEGGPHLFGSFLAEQLIDELFLTLSPQLVGRASDSHRLSLVEDHSFTPQQASRAELISVKQADDHLLLRYRLS
jgi:riboflavin biosynthesis pyrimidine reductase